MRIRPPSHGSCALTKALASRSEDGSLVLKTSPIQGMIRYVTLLRYHRVIAIFLKTPSINRIITHHARRFYDQLGIISFLAGFLAVTEETVTIDVVCIAKDALLDNVLTCDTVRGDECDLSAGTAQVDGSHLVVGWFRWIALFLQKIKVNWIGNCYFFEISGMCIHIYIRRYILRQHFQDIFESPF